MPRKAMLCWSGMAAWISFSWSGRYSLDHLSRPLTKATSATEALLNLREASAVLSSFMTPGDIC